MSWRAPVDSPTSAIFTATSGNTRRASSAAANDDPSRTRAPTTLSSLAMKRLPTDRAAMSRALTSGKPPPSSVDSVRAICDVAQHRHAEQPVIQPRPLAGLPRPGIDRDGTGQNDEQEQPEVRHDEGGEPDDRARGQRQLSVERFVKV